MKKTDAHWSIGQVFLYGAQDRNRTGTGYWPAGF